MKIEFPRQIFENTQASSSMKARLWELNFSMWTDGETVRRRERERDVSKVIAADRNFANTPNSDVFWEIRRR
jgi:hypothetical protein